MAEATLLIRESKGPPELANERALARLWSNAHLLTEGLRTEDGRRFRVVYPGRLSGLAGPDFRDSVLETEAGDLLMGDIELHMRAPDWYGHGHHRDPAYNGVILHVVLHPRDHRDSVQHSGARTAVASVGSVVDQLSVTDGRGEGPLPWLPSRDGSVLAELLDRAGDRRFLARAAGFALELEGGDPDEVVYGALMVALGYASNRKPFRRLARAVPFSMLRALVNEPRGTRVLAIKAMLLDAADLELDGGPGDSRLETRAMLRCLPRRVRLRPQEWRMSRVRPANHPARRVVGAARLADRHLETGLVNGLAEAAGGGVASALVERLTAKPFIGQGRAREMAVNAVLPVMYAWAGIRRDLRLQESVLALYRGFPGLGDNEMTREMKRLMSPGERPLKVVGARRQQGLVQVYKSMRQRLWDQAGRGGSLRADGVSDELSRPGGAGTVPGLQV